MLTRRTVLTRRQVNAGLLCAPLLFSSRVEARRRRARLPPDPFAGKHIDQLKGGPVLVEAALQRGRALEPQLRAVIEWNAKPHAGAKSTGPLAGIPILVKDNIDTVDMDTTAGSLALLDKRPARDADVVKRLREAGAVIVGKANLSEWANFRSTKSQSGWSARGGQCVNPHGQHRCPCGSSSGSAVAVAAGYVPASIGTETDGSILCPASQCGIVGIKPTVGLLSGQGIIPISKKQDTAGPMARTVRDAAFVLSAMTGQDLGKNVDDGVSKAKSLKGVKVGVLGALRFHLGTQRLFEAAVKDIQALGASIDYRKLAWDRELGKPEWESLLYEFRVEIDAYLAARGGKQKSLLDLIDFNAAHPKELALFGQEIFDEAAATVGVTEAEYKKQRSLAGKIAKDGLHAQLKGLDVLIAPTTGPAWVLDEVYGDHFSGGSSTSASAVAGWPAVTVPMGRFRGLPVGMSFMGRPGEEAKILGYAHAYEQRTKHFRSPKLAI